MVEQDAKAEVQPPVWMKTAQQAEEWADQLGKVHLWLEEQLVLQRKELHAAYRDKAQVLAELSAAQDLCQTMQRTLERQQKELLHLEARRSAMERQLDETSGRLHALEQSKAVRLVRWLALKSVPPHSLRRRLAVMSVKLTKRLLPSR